ncbi:MAG: sigma-70 family RNA polymerase sigma factor [bacterium]|nr:sigma-70 family RNA polymerase sigma factor [bacterium]
MNKKKEFEKVYSTYYKQAFYICYSIIGNYDDAKDAVQDVFINIFRNFEHIKEMKSYICMSARNLSINRVCRKHETVELNEDIAFSTLSVEDEVLRRERMEKVGRKLSLLSEQEKNVFTRKFYMGMDYTEISAELNITESTCRVAFRNSLMKLKEEDNV